MKEKKVTRKNIDWAKAKSWFLADHTRTLGDVALHVKANPATVRERAGKDKWLQERNTMATAIQKEATERLQAEQVDLAARCNQETIMIARAIRQKVAQFLKQELNPSELNAVASAHDKAVIQERLGLGMSTTNSELTGKNGVDLIPTSGVLVIPAAMDHESWERAVAQQQQELTNRK